MFHHEEFKNHPGCEHYADIKEHLCSKLEFYNTRTMVNNDTFIEEVYAFPQEEGKSSFLCVSFWFTISDVNPLEAAFGFFDQEVKSETDVQLTPLNLEEVLDRPGMGRDMILHNMDLFKAMDDVYSPERIKNLKS